MTEPKPSEILNAITAGHRPVDRCLDGRTPVLVASNPAKVAAVGR